MEVYYGNIEPQTDEERKLVKQHQEDLAQVYRDRMWQSKDPGPVGNARFFPKPKYH